MIEPIIGDKQCSKCGVCKPLTDFLRRHDLPSGYAGRCKACERKRVRARPKSRHEASPTAWLLPADPRPFGQQLANATQRKWRYPVEPAVNLTWRIAV